MQFDDFDKKIKEAAEHHHPAYDEKAWDKMERLLDKHLPNEKDDKRRFILLLLLLLLTGAGIYLSLAKPWQSKNLTDKTNVSLAKEAPEQSTVSSTKDAESKSVKSTATPESGQAEVTATTDKTKKTKISKDPGSDKLNDNSKNAVNKTSPEIKDNNASVIHDKALLSTPIVEKSNSHITKKKIKQPINDKTDKDAVTDNSIGNKTGNSTAVTRPQNNVIKDNTKNTSQGNILPADKPVIDNTAVNTNTPPATIVKTIADSASQKKPDVVAKIEDEKKIAEPQKKENKKPGRQKKSSFAITFTGSPDLSTVGLTNTGKVKLSYGAGLSYTLNRFTLRSGFYVSRKVYTAGPNEYHPPQHYWTYYVNLTKINADCKVYEIPVTISYNFSQTHKYNLFASTGLSTYLMKRETYDYYYKDPSSQTIENKSWTFNNANKHFFTILNLSAGYERKLNRSLSLTAEPYIKIPLDGIGFGNLKLNSAGIAITLSVNPFARKK